MSATMVPEIELLAVQYPGRQDRFREPCIENVETMTDLVTKAMLTRLDLPIALFGHSLGAVIAFEVARRLEADGNPVAVLFASGRRAPSLHRKETMHLQSDDEILTELGRMDGTDPNVLQDPELMEMILPAVRSDYRAIADYRYKPGAPLTCRISAMIGDCDDKATEEEAAAWREHTTGGFDLSTFTGGHFYLAHCQEAVVRLIADRLLPDPDPAGRLAA
jgi:surfactin synthase thioesterase subunit